MPDETRDADGFHIYLRDLDDNFVWSAGYQPTRIARRNMSFTVTGAWPRSCGWIATSNAGLRYAFRRMTILRFAVAN